MKKIKKNNEKIDFKLNYMATMFRKISHKRFETYVIQRIWHRLNDNEIQFVTQQYVDRPKDDEYALADLYLPQVKMVVEINEPYHYDEYQSQRDAIRNADISRVASSEIHVVDCRGSIEEVNNQIETIVERIRAKKLEMGSKFLPWLGISDKPREYYASKGYFDINENEYIETIDDICDIFHTKAKHRGYLRAGSVELYGNTELWFPNADNEKWYNELTDDGQYIIEYPYREVKPNVKDPAKKHNVITAEMLEKRHDWMLENTVRKCRRMITFFRQKDDLGFKYYKFVGVFEIDKPRSTATVMCYWKRVTDKVDLNEELKKMRDEQ